MFDDLRTNENAHSLFLVRLFQFTPTLLDFIQFINNKYSGKFAFDISDIKKPKITAEQLRIDALILENSKYAIIFENKIHGAGDQEHQIGRYIDKCKLLGINQTQIYILYLTREGEVPSTQTWGKYNPDDFTDRFLALSYKKDILSWIEAYLNKLPDKESLTKSAIIQYIDHLKHTFNNKEIYSNMNNELEKFLIKEIGFSDDKITNVELISEKIKEINKVSEQLKELSSHVKKEIFSDWKNRIETSSNLSKYQPVLKFDTSVLQVGIIIKYNEIPFTVLIEHNFNSIYFGICSKHAGEILNPKVKTYFEPLLSEEVLIEENKWYGWKYTSFENAYVRFEDLCKKIISKLSDGILN